MHILWYIGCLLGPKSLSVLRRLLMHRKQICSFMLAFIYDIAWRPLTNHHTPSRATSYDRNCVMAVVIVMSGDGLQRYSFRGKPSNPVALTSSHMTHPDHLCRVE